MVAAALIVTDSQRVQLARMAAVDVVASVVRGPGIGRVAGPYRRRAAGVSSEAP